MWSYQAYFPEQKVIAPENALYYQGEGGKVGQRVVAGGCATPPLVGMMEEQYGRTKQRRILKWNPV